MDKDLFLYEIQNSDLTDASVANKFVSPRLNAAFMVKLRELAKLIKKLRGEAAPLESPRPPESPPLVTLTPDLIRSQEFTLLKVKEACKLHKLRTGAADLQHNTSNGYCRVGCHQPTKICLARAGQPGHGLSSPP